MARACWWTWTTWTTWILWKMCNKMHRTSTATLTEDAILPGLMRPPPGLGLGTALRDVLHFGWPRHKFEIDSTSLWTSLNYSFRPHFPSFPPYLNILISQLSSTGKLNRQPFAVPPVPHGLPHAPPGLDSPKGQSCLCFAFWGRYQVNSSLLALITNCSWRMLKQNGI